MGSQSRCKDFSSFTGSRNEEELTFRRNSQFTSELDVPQPMPKKLRSSFPELIGMNAGEANGPIAHMSKLKTSLSSIINSTLFPPKSTIKDYRFS